MKPIIEMVKKGDVFAVATKTSVASAIKASAKRGRLLQVFLNTDLRNGHDGLAALAAKSDIHVSKLTPGQYVMFLNPQRTKLKLFAANGVVAYLRLGSGRVYSLEALRLIPEAFNGSGEIDYDKALKRSVEEALSRKGHQLLPAPEA